MCVRKFRIYDKYTRAVYPNASLSTILSLAGSWGRCVGKVRESLADVISIYDLLTNQILVPSFEAVVIREDYAFAK